MNSRVLRASVCACLMLAVRWSAAQDVAYKDSIHIDRNAGTVTINKNTIYQVDPRVTESAVRELLESARQRTKSDSEALFKKNLNTLNARLASHGNSLSEMVSRLKTIDEVQLELTAKLESLRKETSDTSRDSAKHVEEHLGALRAQLQVVLDAIVKGELGRARTASARAERITFDYDQRTGFGVLFLLQSVLVDVEKPFGVLTHSVGPRFTYDVKFFSATGRQRLRAAIALLIGGGKAAGGYADPTGELLIRETFSVPHLWLQAGMHVETVIGARGNVEFGPSIRGGYFSYDSEQVSMPVFGSLQLPLHVQVSYKPWAMVSVGALVGTGLELFSRRPSKQYTGIGANTVRAESNVSVLLEAGVHASYRW